MNSFVRLLEANGYGFADHVKDFGSVLSGVDYLSRTTGNIHEYVQVIFYGDTFCEAVYEIYVAPKNTTRFKGNSTVEAVRKGQQSLTANIARNFSELEEMACRSVVDLVRSSTEQLVALELAEKADRNRRK